MTSGVDGRSARLAIHNLRTITTHYLVWKTLCKRSNSGDSFSFFLFALQKMIAISSTFSNLLDLAGETFLPVTVLFDFRLHRVCLAMLFCDSEGWTSTHNCRVHFFEPSMCTKQNHRSAPVAQHGCKSPRIKRQMGCLSCNGRMAGIVNRPRSKCGVATRL